MQILHATCQEERAKTDFLPLGHLQSVQDWDWGHQNHEVCQYPWNWVSPLQDLPVTAMMGHLRLPNRSNRYTDECIHQDCRHSPADHYCSQDVHCKLKTWEDEYSMKLNDDSHLGKCQTRSLQERVGIGDL